MHNDKLTDSSLVYLGALPSLVVLNIDDVDGITENGVQQMMSFKKEWQLSHDPYDFLDGWTLHYVIIVRKRYSKKIQLEHFRLQHHSKLQI